MKFCYACGNSTGGKPLYCNFCGRSYDVKVCARLHSNPRWAEACSRCGSRNLSLPQPRIPLLWRLLGAAILGFTGVLLLGISVDLAFDPRLRWQVRVLLFAILTALWSTIPHVLRIAIHRLLKQRRRDDSR
jgi:hypothetical protein